MKANKQMKMNLQFFAEDPTPNPEEKTEVGGARNLSSLELQNTLQNIMNVSEDRGRLALEMVNVTNATNRIINERNTLLEEKAAYEKQLQAANQQIGELYSQIAKPATTGEDRMNQTKTQKTIFELGRGGK